MELSHEDVMLLAGGQILKQVMLEGVEQGIVALPVHDAVAVMQDNANWAKEAMLRAS